MLHNLSLSRLFEDDPNQDCMPTFQDQPTWFYLILNDSKYLLAVAKFPKLGFEVYHNLRCLPNNGSNQLLWFYVVHFWFMCQFINLIVLRQWQYFVVRSFPFKSATSGWFMLFVISSYSCCLTTVYPKSLALERICEMLGSFAVLNKSVKSGFDMVTKFNLSACTLT